MQPVEAAGVGIGPEYPTRIMGVLNVSEESPYDPSVFTDASDAAAYIDERLIDEGADIVDIGLASANKRVSVLSAAEELERLNTALAAIDEVAGEAIFSLETRYATVAEAALAEGFAMINDICGFADPQMAEVCTEADVPVVKMAGPGELERPGALTTVDEIYDALAADPLPEKTIIDPAFGGWCEGKDEAIDREIFERLGEFRGLNRPILVSINRKNFLRNLAGRTTEEALPVSLAATSMAIERGANVIRTHDVAATRDAARIGDAFSPPRLRDPSLGITEHHIDTGAELSRHLARIGAVEDHRAGVGSSVFELTKLTPTEEQELASIVDSTGGNLIRGEAGCLLFVDAASLSDLAQQVSSPAVERVIEPIATHLP